MKATIEEPKAAPLGAKVTLGAWAVTSERLFWLRFSSIWAFTAVMAIGVFSRLCSRNCAVTTTSPTVLFDCPWLLVLGLPPPAGAGLD